ncbi:hypothetical protein MHU86_20338 [Fragilaria crotonensis]|nr:hypothetical protein MHU86_20338 [Fragilaria crotonensis]
MGTPISNKLVMIAMLIAAATYTLLRRDLNVKYNSTAVKRSITVSAGIVLSSDAQASTSATMSYEPPQGSHVWIFVERFSEGMATWRISLAQILQVAKKLNATVVEPCILRGHLQACGKDAVGLDYVYDTNKLRQYHPHIASHEDYLTMLATEKPVIVPMCFQAPQGNVEKYCGNLPNMWQKKVNAPLERALKQKDVTTVIHIKYYRSDGFVKTRVGGKALLGLFDATWQVLDEYFVFQPKHYDTVDYLLQLMGISNTSDFDVIHWRAEIATLDYDDCATKILQARQAMGSNTTVLMSSINTHAEMQWYTPERFNPSDAQRNLDRLLDSGFLKVDQVLDKVRNLIPDKIVIPVWDQIIAQKAQRFATCTKQCGDTNHLCAACNFRGVFAQTTVDLRAKIGKSSHECWPIESE